MVCWCPWNQGLEGFVAGLLWQGRWRRVCYAASAWHNRSTGVHRQTAQVQSRIDHLSPSQHALDAVADRLKHAQARLDSAASTRPQRPPIGWRNCNGTCRTACF